MVLNRLRAHIPVIAGATIAIMLAGGIGLISGRVRTALQLDMNRKLVTGMGVGGATLVVALALLVWTLILQGRRQSSIAAFFTQPVLPIQSAFAKGMVYFITYGASLAFVILFFGFLDR